MRNAIILIFHSLDILNKKDSFQATMAQSVEHATAVQMVLGSSLGRSLQVCIKSELLSVVNGSEKI